MTKVQQNPNLCAHGSVKSKSRKVEQSYGIIVLYELSTCSLFKLLYVKVRQISHCSGKDKVTLPKVTRSGQILSEVLTF